MTSLGPASALTLAAMLLAACSPAPTPGMGAAARLVDRARVGMGSEVRVTAWTADEPGAVAAFEAVFDEIDRLDRLMSVWHEGSDVQRLNAAAGRHAVPVSPEVLDVLQLARQAGVWTDGAFDVTFGALSGLWKFDHDQDNRLPQPAEVAARLPLVDYRLLAVDARAGTAFLRRAGMRVHLGGIGKGYAVDRAAAILRSRGVRDFMIQSGGDLYAAGRHGDRPWRAGIRDPRGEGIFAAMDLTDATLSTSGDYERFFVEDGRRYHHILDPADGQPARGARSVSIVTDRAAVADALSTGVFVAGPEAGMRLIEQLPGVEGVIVTDRNDVLVSTGLRARLERLASPTDAP
jgi:thiamine biosynthesis lipoprotein